MDGPAVQYLNRLEISMRVPTRLIAAGATLAGFAALAPSAMADTRFYASMGNSAMDGGSAYIYDAAGGFFGGHSYHRDLIRNGAVIASGDSSWASAYVQVPDKGALA